MSRRQVIRPTTEEQQPPAPPPMAWYADLHPLNAPGMPPPGPDFLRAAALLGDQTTQVSGKGPAQVLTAAGPQLAEVIHECLYGRGQYQMYITVKGTQTKYLPIIPGHLWGDIDRDGVSGPVPAEVMVIGKMQGKEEVARGRCFIGPSGQHLLEAVRKLGIPGAQHWYITNVLKCPHPEGEGESTLRQGWVREFLHLLHQELRLVRPKYILCLGADAVKALLGKNWTLDKLQGRVEEFTFPVHTSPDQEPEYHTSQVMCCIHPAAVLHTPDKQGPFERDLSRFSRLLAGVRWDRQEEGLDHRIIDNEPDLIALCQEVEEYCRSDRSAMKNVIAWDAEWHGEHPENKGAYLRTVQLSWRHKSAAAIVLRRAGGEPAFYRLLGGRLVVDGGQPVAMRHLLRLMQGKRACGAFLNADLEWFIPNGLDLRPQFAAPPTWQECLTKGGLDVANMAHAVDETGDFSLNGILQTYTNAPRYDVDLIKWKEKYCKEHGIKAKDLEGYGDCPDEILLGSDEHPSYACYDADVTRRACGELMQRLSSDRYGNNCWEAFWISQRAAPAALEIKRTGLLLDKKRVDELTTVYMQARNELEDRIRQWAKWPELNLSSVFQVRELLFGTKYNGKEKVDGKPVRLRPPGALTLAAKPLLTTEKRQRPWSDVIAEDKEENFTVSTNKTVLGIMLHEAEKLEVRRNGRWERLNCKNIITDIRNFRFTAQVLRSVLRPPKVEEDSETAWFMEDEDGNWLYDAGLPGAVCDDGRIRTTIYQTKETRRWSSARPPLMNLSKRREADYKLILKDRYRYPLRSPICASPGYTILDADYIGAELFGAAIMSGDELMIEHALRNQLPEDDKNFYDIHSNVAVLAFRYDCPPTKAGLKALGKSHMRIVAKAVLFGLMYGRGAKAIALAAREEGVQITVEEAQRVIDTVFGMYPRLVTFFAACRARAVTQRDAEEPAPLWICGAFGGFRRFSLTKDRKVMGDLEREAMNFPIQNLVADAMSHAIANVYEYRENAWSQGWTKEDLDYRIVLQIHDAMLLEVKNEHVPMVIDEVLPLCMSQLVPIYPCDLDGMPNGTGPFHLGVNVDIYDHWGVEMLPNECEERGIAPKYAHWKYDEKLEGLVNFENFPRQVFRDGRLEQLAS